MASWAVKGRNWGWSNVKVIEDRKIKWNKKLAKIKSKEKSAKVKRKKKEENSLRSHNVLNEIDIFENWGGKKFRKRKREKKRQKSKQQTIW